MAEYKLGEIETIFADIIWDNEPLSSRGNGRAASEMEAHHHLHYTEAAL